jgi:hypothetical protein
LRYETDALFFCLLSVVSLSWVGNLALAYTKPVQDCKVTFSVVYLDRLNNTDVGIPKDAVKDVQKKLSAYGDVCYAGNNKGDLVFFIHTTPAVYHGTHVYTNNSTSAAAATDGNGNAAAAAASSSSTTAVPYSVDYSVFLLDIEKQQPDGSFRIVAGGPGLTQPQNRVPHLRDGFIVAKVGHFRGSENPDTPTSPCR